MTVLKIEKYLRVHGVDLDEWCRRYELTPVTVPCQECGSPLTASIPVARGRRRGLASPKCSCGHEGAPYCVSVKGDLSDLFGGST